MSHLWPMTLLFATTVAAAPTVPAQLDLILKDYGRADAPGVSVLVALDGKVLYRKAFGLANLEERTPITTATNFRLASVTKQFTAAAVLLLAERGKLSLDDPLTRFFPGFARAAHGVKVRHLLGHTSGLLDYEELIPSGTTVPLKDKDVLDLVGKEDRLYFAPGSQFRYSNTGYTLLALIVEKVSGRPFAQFLEKNIFDPLGMAGTVAYEEGISTVARRAYGYSERDGERDGRFERTDQSLTSSVLGDGGIYSSVEDLWRWDQALYGTRLLPAETLAMAFPGRHAHLRPARQRLRLWLVRGLAPGDAQDLALRRDHRVQHVSGPLLGQAAHDHPAHEPERQLPRTDGGSHCRCDPRHAVRRESFRAAVLLVAVALRKVPITWPRWAQAVPAYGIGTMAAFWFLQRTVSLL
ncbi:MAG TPA: serine hydrolase domain-containing protein [Thermoanaerobaculia bacterium]|nr:serine hydrolase domain-containing protein [Thermoanaerobaculia bacterium]